MADVVREFLESSLGTVTPLKFERSITVPYLYTLLTKLKFIPELDSLPSESDMFSAIYAVLYARISDTSTQRIDAWLRGALSHDRVSAVILLNRIRTFVQGKVVIPVREARVREVFEDEAPISHEEQQVLHNRTSFRAEVMQNFYENKKEYTDLDRSMAEHWEKSKERMKASRVYDLRQEEKIKIREIRETELERRRIAREIAALPLPPKLLKSQAELDAADEATKGKTAGKSSKAPAPTAKAQPKGKAPAGKGGKNIPTAEIDIPTDRLPAKEPWQQFCDRMVKQYELLMRGPDGIESTAISYTQRAKTKVQEKREEHRLECIKEEIEKIKSASHHSSQEPPEVQAKVTAEAVVGRLWSEAQAKQEKYEEYVRRIERQKMREQDDLRTRAKLFMRINYAAEFKQRTDHVLGLRKALNAQRKAEKKLAEEKHTNMAEKIVQDLLDFAWKLERGEGFCMSDLHSALSS